MVVDKKRSLQSLNHLPELRQDLISGDWILLAKGRRLRPHELQYTRITKAPPKSSCPFEDPQKSTNGPPLLWFGNPSRGASAKGAAFKDWFLQIVRNKYPAVSYHMKKCPLLLRDGIYTKMSGMGFHEVIITRPHARSFSHLSIKEAELVVRAYQERILTLLKEKCLKYILIFQNHGVEAGASVFHPHSQLLALPIIPPDVGRSLDGARRFYHRHRKCVHCLMINQELKQKTRVVYKNKSFVVLAPYTSRTSFELRIFPLRHQARFETISAADRVFCADALIAALRKLYKGLKNPPYNFFIHTAPVERRHFEHYHWHIEILPKTSKLAGVELGTGIEIIAISPEEAAAYLRKQ